MKTPIQPKKTEAHKSLIMGSNHPDDGTSYAAHLGGGSKRVFGCQEINSTLLRPYHRDNNSLHVHSKHQIESMNDSIGHGPTHRRSGGQTALPLFAAILQMTTIKVCFVAKHTGQTVTACGIPGMNGKPRFPFLNVNKLYKNPH